MSLGSAGGPQPSAGFKKLGRYLTHSKLDDKIKPTLVGERSCKRNAGGTVFLLHDGLINVSLALRPSGSRRVTRCRARRSQMMRYRIPYANTSEKRLYVSTPTLRKAASYVSAAAYVIGSAAYVTDSVAYVLAVPDITKPQRTAVADVKQADCDIRLGCRTDLSQGLYTVSFTYYVKRYVLRKASAYRVDSNSGAEVGA